MDQEKRKLPRFHITPCQFHDEGMQKNFSVQDVSAGGLAIRLVDRDDLPRFAVGSFHKGIVKIEGSKLDCSFRIKYIRGTLIGGEWEQPSPALAKHLQEISLPERLGRGLKRYDLPELSSADWFHNPVGVDLLLYPPLGAAASAQGVGRWTLYVHQDFVQWELDSGVKTGQTLAEDEEGYAHGLVRLETRLIEYDAIPNQSIIRAAKDLVSFASIDDQSLKQLILSHLNGVLTV